MNDDIREKIPLFRSWNMWYGFVIIVLVVMIILFSFFTNYFA